MQNNLGDQFLHLRTRHSNQTNELTSETSQGPPPFVGTKKWQSVRRQNGSGSVEICRENASAVNMETD